MGSVLKLVPNEVGKDFRFQSDAVLEEAVGKGLVNVVIIGEEPDGSTWVSSAANAGEALILMERAKRVIVFGEDD